MKARPQRKTEKPQRRTKDEYPQNRANAVRRLPITMRRDANQRKTKRGEPKKPERGRTTQGGLQGARPSQVAKAKGTRDCATSTQRVAPHKAERERSRVMSETACPMLSGVLPASLVRRSTTCLVNRPCVSNPSGTKSFPRSCALRRYLLFLTLHRASIAESALARVCKSFEGAQGLTTVTSVSRGLGRK